ncbi:MAG: hypothetical protein AB7V08_10435 [Elusimicrobiales bacterium]
MSKVLIADKADPLCEKVRKDRGLEAIVKTGMKPEDERHRVRPGDDRRAPASSP